MEAYELFGQSASDAHVVSACAFRNRFTSWPSPGFPTASYSHGEMGGIFSCSRVPLKDAEEEHLLPTSSSPPTLAESSHESLLSRPSLELPAPPNHIRLARQTSLTLSPPSPPSPPAPLTCRPPPPPSSTSTMTRYPRHFHFCSEAANIQHNIPGPQWVQSS